MCHAFIENIHSDRTSSSTKDSAINSSAVIIQRHVVDVNDEVCIDTVADTPSHIHAWLICQYHTHSNPTWSTKTFALNKTFGKHWTRISEITTRNEIHLHNTNSTLKHMLAVICTVNGIFDLRIPKYHVHMRIQWLTWEYSRLSTITIYANSVHQPTSHTSNPIESLQIYYYTMFCPKSKLEHPEIMVSLPRG